MGLCRWQDEEHTSASDSELRQPGERSNFQLGCKRGPRLFFARVGANVQRVEEFLRLVVATIFL
jgi:hypothetical protein